MAISVWVREREQLDAIGELPDGVELHVIPRGESPPDAIREAEFLVPPFDSPRVLELLAGMPRLAVVQAISAGVDSLLPWVPEAVTLCNARGVRDLAVAEWAIAAILSMEKRLPDFVRRMEGHEWRHELLDELAGKHALIVGHGSIGRLLAERLTALGLRVTGVSSRARASENGVRVHAAEHLPELIGHADVVVLLVPLTPATDRLLDERMIARMRAGALLVNASRGAVVDTTALLEQLQAGRIRAALDVTDPEPLPPDHPLWDTPGLLLTPHLAGDSPQSERRVYRFVGEQIRRYAEGAPLLNVVRGAVRRA